jgi:hypothetical protein
VGPLSAVPILTNPISMLSATISLIRGLRPCRVRALTKILPEKSESFIQDMDQVQPIIEMWSRASWFLGGVRSILAGKMNCESQAKSS